MVIDKQTMQRARRVPDAHAHRAIQTALDNLDAQRAPRRTPWVPMAAAGAAALMLVAVLAGVPPLRHRAVSFALDALGRAVPEADRVNPAGGGAQPTARANSAFLLYADADPFYTQVARIAQVVGVSQTVNGITVTVEEAAVTLNRLFLVLRFENVPQRCFPAEEALRVTVNGQACPVSSQKLEKGDRYAAALDVLATFDEQDASIPVKVAFALRQFPDGGQGKGEKIAVFDLRFEMKPTAYVYVEDQQKGPVLVKVDSNAPAETPLVSPDGSAPTPAPEATAKAVSSLSIKLTDLPNPYPPDQAVANGDYVNIHGGTSNSDRMAAFLEAVYAKRAAAIRCTNYTVEGDAVITDIVFDGSKFSVQIDTTRDAFGEQQVTQHEYRNMLEHRQDGTTQVFLTNGAKITEDLYQNGFDGYLLTSWQSDSAPAATPAAEVIVKAEPSSTPEPTETPEPSPTPVPTTFDADAQTETEETAAPTAHPQITVGGQPWTPHGVPMGDRLLSIAVPEALQTFTGEDAAKNIPLALKETLGENFVPLRVYDGAGGSVLSLAWDPGTADIAEAAKELDAYWTRGETRTNAAGNEVTVFAGRTDRTDFTSTLLVYRLPGGATLDGKAYPLLVVQVISPNHRDKWVAGLLEHTSIQ